MIRRRKADPKARAQELVEQGMPYQMAMAVALGKLKLNEALEKMARNDRVARLEREHDLDKALATQVALGQADLDHVLWKRRLHDHRNDNRTRTILHAGASLALGLHGARQVKGTLVENRRYDVIFQPEGAEPEEVHKLQIKYGYDPSAWKAAKKAIKRDKNVAALGLDPIPKPQDRYACSDKRLFRYLENKTEVTITTLEGDVIRGVPTWFSSYECGLGVRGDAEIVVFRHAFHSVAH